MWSLATTFILLLATSGVIDAQQPSSGASGDSDVGDSSSSARTDGTSGRGAEECFPSEGCEDLLQYRINATWSITEEALSGTTLQHVIDCVCTGDTVALHADAPIQEAVMINKSIEITTISGANQSAQFECPESTSGIFMIESSVILSRIKIANCKANSKNQSMPSPVTIQGCHVIRLLDIVFQNNTHDVNPAALDIKVCNDNSNQVLNMTNVVFIENEVTKSGNETKEVPIAKLTGMTYMTSVKVEDNIGDDAVFFVSNADVHIEDIIAQGNSMSVLRFESSTIAVDDGIFEDNGLLNKTKGGALRFDTSSADISNVTFQRNNGGKGGVLYAHGGSSITIRRCRVKNNNAFNGGGFWLRNMGVVIVSDTIFSKNKAFKDGAAILSDDTILQIANCTFQKNNATGGGGCMKINRGALEIMKSEIRGNSAKSGAAVQAGLGNFMCRDVLFRENEASEGGACQFSDMHNVGIHRTSFLMNHAANDGGAIRSKNTENLTINGCTFRKNSAIDAGGCMKMKEGGTVIEHTRMEMNSAAFGAVIRTERGTLNCLDVNFTDNDALNTGGACYFDDNAELTLDSCVFQKNTALYGGAFYAQSCPSFKMWNTTLENNEANLIAGGASVDNSTLDIQNVNCIGNKGQYGGAFHLLNVTLDGYGLKFRDNLGSEGGAIGMKNSTIRIHALNGMNDSIGMEAIGNRALRAGGALDIQSTVMNLSESILKDNVAAEGGALQIWNSTVSIKHSEFRNNTADSVGGSIVALTPEHHPRRLDLDVVTLSENKALVGGGIHSVSVDLIMDGCNLTKNIAQHNGGAIHFEHGRDSHQKVEIKNSVFRNCEAEESGGAVYILVAKKADLTMHVSASTLSDNKARNGGAFWLQSTAIEIHDTILDGNQVIENGGGIFARQVKNFNASGLTVGNNKGVSGGGLIFEDSSQLNLTLVRLEDNRVSKEGGGIRLVHSMLIGRKVNFKGNKAVKGAGLSLDTNSSFICGSCNFSENSASVQGGGIDAVSDNSTKIAAQCTRCTFISNEAMYGAGVHFIKIHEFQNNCLKANTAWGGVVIEGSEFLANNALKRGSAIHSNAEACIFVNCTLPQPSSGIPDFSIPELQGSAERDRCSLQSDHRNSVPTVSTYVTYVLLNINKSKAWTKNSSTGVYKTKEGFVSGILLPKLELEAYDAYNQVGAHSMNASFQATIEQSDDTYASLLDQDTVGMNDGFGKFSEVRTKNVDDGVYRLKISFNADGVEAIDLNVVARPCMIGEKRRKGKEGAFCEWCGPNGYNFNSTAGECQHCPSHANCLEYFIVPVQGYWHTDPCHPQLKKCLNTIACSGTNNETPIREIERNGCMKTKDMSGSYDDKRTALLLRLANISSISSVAAGQCPIHTDPECWDGKETLIDTYRKAMCAEGYEGVLCGTCSEGYGRTPNFRCSRCWTDLAYSAVLIIAVLWMIVVVAITIRGNRIRSPLVISDMFPKRTVEYDALPLEVKAPSTLEIGDQNNDLSGSNEWKEAWTETCLLSAEQLALEKQVQLSKWKVCEIVKVMVNFLQAVAVASLINVEWTSRVKALLVFVDIAGGASVEAISNAVYCLSDDWDVKQIVATQVAGLVGPLMIAILYAIFHFTRCAWKKEGIAVFTKRTILSFLAVLYFSYLTITKQSVLVFMPVEVHVLENDYQHNSATSGALSKFWAQDTSIEYNSDQHMFLVAFASLFLISITVGFPIISSVVLRHYRERAGLGPEGPVYHRMGFLYRAFSPDLPHWESLIMARKAALSLIAVFSYNLGGIKQSLLAILVLVVAMYWQAGWMPYREEFGFINTLELSSLFVSSLVFVLACFFSEGIASLLVREVISFFVIMPIVVFVCWLCSQLFFSVVEYFRAHLDAAGLKYRGNSRLIVICRWITYKCGRNIPSGGNIHELATLT